jgi:CheY-like chemotaxis protein
VWLREYSDSGGKNGAMMKDPVKILLIDDDVDFIEISKLSLAGSGYQVFSAGNAKEGWKMIEDETPDLIILDLMMESLDSGIKLSQQIKNHPRYASIPILMLTSISRDTGMDFTPRTREDLKQLHVDDFCTKPIKPKALIEIIKKLLSRNLKKEMP